MSLAGALHSGVPGLSRAHERGGPFYHPYPLHYGGGWVQKPPPSSDGCSHDQTNDGSCVPTFNQHLLTAQFAQNDKDGRSGIFGGNGREQWVADSGATFHVTGNPVGMVECNPPPLGRRSLVIGDMRSLKIDALGIYRW